MAQVAPPTSRQAQLSDLTWPAVATAAASAAAVQSWIIHTADFPASTYSAPSYPSLPLAPVDVLASSAQAIELFRAGAFDTHVQEIAQLNSSSCAYLFLKPRNHVKAAILRDINGPERKELLHTLKDQGAVISADGSNTLQPPKESMYPMVSSVCLWSVIAFLAARSFVKKAREISAQTKVRLPVSHLRSERRGAETQESGNVHSEGESRPPVNAAGDFYPKEGTGHVLSHTPNSTAVSNTDSLAVSDLTVNANLESTRNGTGESEVTSVSQSPTVLVTSDLWERCQKLSYELDQERQRGMPPDYSKLISMLILIEDLVLGIDLGRGTDRKVQEFIDGVKDYFQSQNIGNSSSTAKIAHLHQYLFEDLQFEGNTTDFHALKNSLIRSVLEEKKGLPILLSAVYLIGARAVELEAVGLGLPGRFCVSVTDDQHRQMIVDPFSGGRVLNKTEVRELIRETYGQFIWSDKVLEPIDLRHFGTRILQNLIHCYGDEGQFEQVAKCLTMELSLFPEQLHLKRDLGLALSSSGFLHEARALLEEYLASSPDDPQRANLEELLRVLNS